MSKALALDITEGMVIGDEDTGTWVTVTEAADEGNIVIVGYRSLTPEPGQDFFEDDRELVTFALDPVDIVHVHRAAA